MRALAASIVCALGAAAAAGGFTPPPLKGHIVDTANLVSASDQQVIDARLEQFRLQTGFAIVVFVAGSLAGDSIDDVAYKTFKEWKIGEAGKDNGILLVIAPVERKVRIETGKGVGGVVTDLQSNDVIAKMKPALGKGQLVAAIDIACTQLQAMMKGEGKRVTTTISTKFHKVGWGAWWFWLIVGGILAIPGIAMLTKYSPRARRIFGPLGGGARGIMNAVPSRSSDPDDYDDRPRGFGGGSGGDYGGGGSDYTGGGGESGGGGSSDSY